MGVDEEHPVAFVLPNLPETHFAIWGGEAAGVVLAINPMFEAGQIAELLRTARVRVLVTLGPVPGMELWEKLAPHLATLPDLKVAALVDPVVYSGRTGAAPSTPASALVPGIEIADFRLAMQAQPAGRLIAPRIISENSKSSYFCTGGTTGAPKIAVRTHGNEVTTLGQEPCAQRPAIRGRFSADCPCFRQCATRHRACTLDGWQSCAACDASGISRQACDR